MHPNEARAIANWRYAVRDNSISTKLLTPFWELCARAVPRRVTPNMLTLGSATCNVGCAFAALAAHGAGPGAPGGVAWMLAAAALAFSAQTLDAIDGKHARNTGQASRRLGRRR